MNRFKQWLMRRYCPLYEENMPHEERGSYRVEAIIISGYWNNHVDRVGSHVVHGSLREAYMSARWLALKEQWKRPIWLRPSSIHYGVNKL